MKRSSVAVFVVSFALTMIGIGLFMPKPAQADGKVTCIVSVQTGAATPTTAVVWDAGTLCLWTAGATVAMQCEDVAVCYDPTGTATVAGDLCADFKAGYAPVDPILISLKPSEKVISLIMKGLAVDG